MIAAVNYERSTQAKAAASRHLPYSIVLTMTESARKPLCGPKQILQSTTMRNIR